MTVCTLALPAAMLLPFAMTTASTAAGNFNGLSKLNLFTGGR
jgi:hypothetical protein